MPNSVLTYSPRDPSQFPNWTFQHLDLEYDAASQSVWMSYKAASPPYYSLQTLTDMADVRESLRLLFRSEEARARWPIRYFVHASNKPGVFSLGGDLATFAASIRRRDRETLLHYAYACIDVIYGLATSFELPIVTVSAIHGQCLAGGFEAALTADFLIAETHAKLGVPEVAFNTFPGMGAVTLLTRRLGSVRAHEIISEGKVYSGAEMHEWGAIDVLVPDAALREQTLCWIMDGGEERWRRRLALAETRRLCFPVSNEELIRITELWTDCSCAITDADLRHMERIVGAQKRMSSKGGTQEPSPSPDAGRGALTNGYVGRQARTRRDRIGDLCRSRGDLVRDAGIIPGRRVRRAARSRHRSLRDMGRRLRLSLGRDARRRGLSALRPRHP